MNPLEPLVGLELEQLESFGVPRIQAVRIFSNPLEF